MPEPGENVVEKNVIHRNIELVKFSTVCRDKLVKRPRQMNGRVKLPLSQSMATQILGLSNPSIMAFITAN